MLVSLCLAVGLAVQSDGLMGRALPVGPLSTVDGQSVVMGEGKKAKVLFVFCSCVECRRVAESWKSVAPSAVGAPETYVVYEGSQAETKAFGGRIGLANARFIADRDSSLAGSLRAMPCPAIFVLDKKGTVRYASKEVAGEFASDAGLLVGQALEALRSISQNPNQPRLAPLPPKPSPKLDFEIVGGVTSEGPGEAAVEVEVGDGAVTVKRSLRLWNRTPSPVRVESVLSSCGCQRAVMVQGSVEVTGAVIPPGSSVTLKVSMEMSEQESSKSSSVWIYSNGVSPLASLRIRGVRKVAAVGP